MLADVQKVSCFVKTGSALKQPMTVQLGNGVLLCPIGMETDYFNYIF